MQQSWWNYGQKVLVLHMSNQLCCSEKVVKLYHAQLQCKRYTYDKSNENKYSGIS